MGGNGLLKKGATGHEGGHVHEVFEAIKHPAVMVFMGRRRRRSCEQWSGLNSINLPGPICGPKGGIDMKMGSLPAKDLEFGIYEKGLQTSCVKVGKMPKAFRFETANFG